MRGLEAPALSGPTMDLEDGLEGQGLRLAVTMLFGDFQR
jgi:hypothetical protein